LKPDVPRLHIGSSSISRRHGKGPCAPRIYRALDFLFEHGLIHKVECLNVFIAYTGGHHRHSVQFLICRHCGFVAEIEDGAVSHALERAAKLAMR
jgi:Fur family zinc uptake transcriptional regulator